MRYLYTYLGLKLRNGIYEKNTNVIKSQLLTHGLVGDEVREIRLNSNFLQVNRPANCI